MEENKFEHEIKKLDNRVKWILLIGAVALISFPILSTQLDWFLDFTKTGQIGDTLGGITAPVIGAVSALLIYFSFRAQINANRIIQNQIDDQKKEEASKKNFDHQMERYKHLREHVVDFTFITYERRGSVGAAKLEKVVNKGSDAIFLFLLSEEKSYFKGESLDGKQHQYSQLRAILSFFSLILNHLEPLKNDQDTKFIFNLIEVLFYRHLWDRVSGLADKVLKEPKNSENVIVQIFEKIRGIEVELEKYKEIYPN